MIDAPLPNEGSNASGASPHHTPAIHFSAVVVDRLSFTDIGPNERKPEQLQFSFGIQRRQFEDASIREVTVLVRIGPGPEQSSKFGFEAAVTGRFQKIDGPGVMTLDEFTRTNAPALVMPYVREIVTNITARSRHGTIIFPPVNVIKLVAEEHPTGGTAKE